MSEDKTYAKGNGITKLLVTSVYENLQNVKDEYNIALNIKAQEKLLNSNNTYNAEYTGSANLSKPLGSLISASYETDKTSMSKGKLYMNSISEQKSDVEFNNKLNINTSIANINGTLEINDNLPYYNDNKQNYENGMSYKNVKVSKQEFENILGKDGKLELLDDKGQLIATIDSSSKLEDGNYVVDLKDNVKTINYRSSKILKEGNIIIKESRKITTSRYPINLLKDLNKLSFDKQVNVVINNNGKEEKVKIADAISSVELLNTKTKATLRTNKQELYSVVENNDVEFVIELNNNKEESDIYGTSVYEIVLPNTIKDIKIKDTNILYGEGLKIENTSVYTRDGKKVIRVLVSGTQKSVNNGHLTNGTNLVVNTDISVDEETPKQEIQYNLVYSNVNATTYEQASDFVMGAHNEAFRRFGNGVAITKAKIASPEGLVVANRYKNYSDTGAEIVTIKQGNKDAVLRAGDKARTISKQVLMINNLNTELPNAKLLGRLPVEGVLNVETGQSLNNNLNITLASGITKVDNTNVAYDVYYSENVNANVDLNNPQNGWTTNPNDLSKVKSYMIAFKDSIKPGQVNKFNLSLNLPANIDYNKSAVGTDQVIFDVKTAKGVEQYTSWSDMIRLTTGEGVSLEGKLTPEIKKVEQGKEVRYTYEVKNEAKTLKAKNVENYIESPAGFDIVKIETPEKEIPFSRDSDGNIKFGMEDIEAGEKRQVRLTFRAVGTQSLELKIRTRAEGTTVVKETRAEKVDVAVKEAELELKARGTVKEEDMKGADKYKENSEPTFELLANRNFILDTKINNVKVKLKTSDNLQIQDIQKDSSNTNINKINDREYEISNIDLTKGYGNIGIYSYGQKAKNTGIITVGASDTANDLYNIGMASGFTSGHSPRDAKDTVITPRYIGEIENAGTINVNGAHSIGMYGVGAGTTVTNNGNINLNANNTIGIYVEEGAKAVNNGVIRTGASGLKNTTGIVLGRGSRLVNNNLIDIDATGGVGVYFKGGIIVNEGTINVRGAGARKTFRLNQSATTKGVGRVKIDAPAGSQTATITDNGVVVRPTIVTTTAQKPVSVSASSIGLYVNTSGKTYTNAINNLGALTSEADLIIGAEAAESTLSKYIQINDSKILGSYNNAISNGGVSKWNIYAGSLTWMSTPTLDPDTGAIKNLYMAKIPYTEWASNSKPTPIDRKDTYNFTDGLEQRYGVKELGSRENQVFQKLNSIGNNQEILLYQAFDEMMGHQYANVQQRVQATGNILDKEFNYLRSEWQTASKDSNKIKTFGTRGEYKTDTAGIIDYKYNGYGVAYVHENEDIKLGRGIGWYSGIVQNTVKFKDIGKSKEEQLQAKVGIFKSVPFDDNNSLNWTISGDIFAGYNKMNRKFLVVDEIFNAKGKYYNYGIGLRNEIGKAFRLSESFSLRPYVGLGLEYGRVSKIREKSGEVKLEVKQKDYISVKPEVGTELAYKHYFGAKTLRAGLGVAYENELGRVANGRNKARVSDTTADWFNIRGEKEDRKGNVKFDLNLGLDNQRYGVTANVGYDTKGENIRGGLGLRIIF